MTYRERLPITVCETNEFLAKAERVWSEEERAEFVDFIALFPEAGELVPGAGGIRKVRWSREGSGKRGGIRVIYYFYDETKPLYLISLFAKNRKSDLSPMDKRDLTLFAKAVKAEAKGGKSEKTRKN